MSDLRTIAHALGGEVFGSQVLAPGPGHSAKDRSLTVKLCPSPDGFVTHSFAGDRWQDCRDHVRAQLGLSRESGPRRAPDHRRPSGPRREESDHGKKIAAALSLWAASVDPRRTLVERYLASRKLDLGHDIAGTVLRWHPGIRAMLALFRNIVTEEPRAVSRTFLDCAGRKLERLFLGPVGGAAIEIDADNAVRHGLHIGEGIETCMSARQLGLRPTWALGSCGAIAAVPILGGVECLTVLVDHDANGVGEGAARSVEARWATAGREVVLLRTKARGDFNDLMGGGGE